MQDGIENIVSVNPVTRNTHHDRTIEWRCERKNKGDDRYYKKHKLFWHLQEVAST